MLLLCHNAENTTNGLNLDPFVSASASYSYVCNLKDFLPSSNIECEAKIEKITLYVMAIYKSIFSYNVGFLG